MFETPPIDADPIGFNERSSPSAIYIENVDLSETCVDDNLANDNLLSANKDSSSDDAGRNRTRDGTILDSPLPLLRVNAIASRMSMAADVAAPRMLICVSGVSSVDMVGKFDFLIRSSDWG